MRPPFERLHRPQAHGGRLNGARLRGAKPRHDERTLDRLPRRRCDAKGHPGLKANEKRGIIGGLESVRVEGSFALLATFGGN